MNEQFYYRRDETVRLSSLEGLYVVTATKSRADGNKFERFYQLKGAVTGKVILTNQGNVWWNEKSLRKNHSESYLTFQELMEMCKEDYINREDFE